MIDWVRSRPRQFSWLLGIIFLSPDLTIDYCINIVRPQCGPRKRESARTLMYSIRKECKGTRFYLCLAAPLVFLIYTSSSYLISSHLSSSTLLLFDSIYPKDTPNHYHITANPRPKWSQQHSSWRHCSPSFQLTSSSSTQLSVASMRRFWAPSHVVVKTPSVQTGPCSR